MIIYRSIQILDASRFITPKQYDAVNGLLWRAYNSYQTAFYSESDVRTSLAFKSRKQWKATMREEIKHLRITPTLVDAAEEAMGLVRSAIVGKWKFERYCGSLNIIIPIVVPEVLPSLEEPPMYFSEFAGVSND